MAVGWQAASVNRARLPGRWHWLDAARHPARRDGAVLWALLLLPWVVALVLVRLHHHLDVAAITLIFAVSLGLPTLWATWAALRVAHHDTGKSAGPSLDQAAEGLAGQQERLGRPITDSPGPLALGVHQAVTVGDTRLPELPEYVPRDHDVQLRTIMEAADQASMMVVLVGDSSTGKTRALWEALRYLPGQWRVWSPAGARALNGGLAAVGVGPRTVVWLDDAHNYLGAASQLAGDIAERLIDLIADPDAGRILVAATLWPEYWQQLTAQPRRPAGELAGVGGAEGVSRLPLGRQSRHDRRAHEACEVVEILGPEFQPDLHPDRRSGFPGPAS